MSEIKVSVIIPVYNVEKYLHECMDSIINQTLKEIEIICVDDGSTDNSLSILNEYASKDNRITVIEQENQGAGVARNTGLDLAKGEYLSFLDPDDFFELNMLEATYNKAIDTNVDIVVFGANYYNTVTKIFETRKYPLNSNNVPQKEIFSYKDMPGYIFQSFGYCAWNKLYSKKFVLDKELKFQHLFRANDGLFTYTSIVVAKKITVIDKVYVNYRKGALTNSQATLNKFPLNFTLAEGAIFDKLNELGIYNEIQSSFLKSLLVSTIHNLKSQKTYDEFCMVYNFIKDTYETKYQITKNSFLFDGDTHHNKFLNEYYNILNNNLDEYIKLKEVYLEKSNDKSIRVSIIIPVYNSQKYLVECLDSVVTQTFTNIEIICVDDGSNDGSIGILNRYAEDDSRFVILSQKNQGAGVARNLGLSVAKGEYIAFLDSDDVMIKYAILELLKSAFRTNSDIVISKSYQFSNDINKYAPYKPSMRINFLPIGETFSIKSQSHFLFQITNGVPWGKLYKNEFIKANNLFFPDTSKSEDFFFVFTAYALAQKIAILNKRTIFYRIIRGNGSLEDLKDEFPTAKSVVKRMLYDKLNELGLYSVVEQSFINTVIQGNYSDLELFKKGSSIETVYNIFKEEVKFYNIDMEDMSYFYNKTSYLYMKSLYDSDCLADYIFEKYNSKTVPIKSIDNSKEINQLKGQLKWARSNINKYKGQVKYHKNKSNSIHNSRSYKIGRIITLIPRAFLCFKDNGLAYSVDKLLTKLKFEEDQSKFVYRDIKNKDYNYYKKLPIEYYEVELKEWYHKQTGKILNLDNPRSFNEKIQWLKLYDCTPLKTQLADKYLVRDWVENKIGKEHLIPLLGVWDSFDEIDFEKLPNQFALKTNHGYAFNYIVTDKLTFDINDARQKFQEWLNLNFAYVGLELQYLNIPPKIIAEEYIQNANDLYDYKFMCFNGNVEFLWVGSNRNSKLNKTFFTIDWQPMKYSYKKSLTDYDSITKPVSLPKMIEVVKTLSKDFAYVRVDLYEVGNKVYFGEMTFTPGSGVTQFASEDYNLELGEMIKLPKKKKIPKAKF